MGSSTRSMSTSSWVSLIGICLAAGLVWLAFADLGVAVPTIADDFHADMSTMQWANNAFSLATGALVIAAGKLGDMFGRRRMLVIGIVLFGVFSIVGALATGVTALIAARGLMGIGAAAILPATLALIPVEFAGRAQLAAFGVWQAVAWGGQAIGPAIGGVITSGPGWRWLFWINLPLCLLAAVVVRRTTPESKDDGMSRRIDWAGFATIGLAVFCLLYALTDGPAQGWTSPIVITFLIAAVILAVAWYLTERRVRDPLVDLRLFRIRSYDGALLANLMMNLAFGGMSYLLVLWLQNVRGYDPLVAGLLMLPSTVGIFAFIPLGGRIDARRGARLPVLIGLGVLAVGLALLGFLSASSGLWALAIALVVIGVGLGLLSTPISNTAVGEVPPQLSGSAAGVFKMSSMVGGAIGIAVLSAATRAMTSREAAATFAQYDLSADQRARAQRSLVSSSSFADAVAGLSAAGRRAVESAVATALTDGIAATMVGAAILTVLVGGGVALVWRRRTRGVDDRSDSSVAQ